jgi:hypothetical protein
MVINNIKGVPTDELELTEAKLFVNKLFILGDYKHFADKFQINRGDLKKILYEASIFLAEKNISCTIALILKLVKKSREVYVSCTGAGASFIINNQSLSILNKDVNSGELITQPCSFEQPHLFAEKLNKEDTLLICSENLSLLLDNNLIKQLVVSSKEPEEVCKKLLHSVSRAERKDNISIAAFNGSGNRRNSDSKKISNKILLLIIIPLLLIFIGLLTYYLSSGANDTPQKAPIINFSESSNLPPVIIKDSISQSPGKDTQITTKENVVKKNEEHVKKFKYVNFIVNGSVVIISNWDSVEPEILNINWDNGIKDKKSIHKYPDYTSIPSFVKVTYKDYSTKSYRLK